MSNKSKQPLSNDIYKK